MQATTTTNIQQQQIMCWYRPQENSSLFWTARGSGRKNTFDQIHLFPACQKKHLYLSTGSEVLSLKYVADTGTF